MVNARGVALVRRPSPALANGLLTFQTPSAVDIDLAMAQHDAYRAALAAAGWETREVHPLDQAPDGVFVEDTAVVCGGLAVLARPGALERRIEVDSTEEALRNLGLDVLSINEPGTLDGGDVLQVGATVYVGQSSRTNAEGIRQLSLYLAQVGRAVIPVRLGAVLHLKSALTALPDGSVIGLPHLVDPVAFRQVRKAADDNGANVLSVGDEGVLVPISAPRTADQLCELGFSPITVDISEFEKLEGSVTCLSILIPN